MKRMIINKFKIAPALLLALFTSVSLAGQVGVRYANKGNRLLMIFKTSGPAPYTAYRLIHPPRIVVDLSGERFSRTGYFKVRFPHIKGVKLINSSVRAIGAEAKAVIYLNDPLDYDIVRKGNYVVLDLYYTSPSNALDGAPQAVAEEEINLTEAGEEEVTEEFEAGEELEEEIPEGPEEVTEGEAAPVIEEVTPATAPAPVTSEAVEEAVTEEVPAPEAEVALPQRATKILDVKTQVEGGTTVVEIVGNGPIGDYNAFTLENPTRVVIDIRDVGNLYPTNELSLNTPAVKNIRIGQHPDKVRFVLDVPENVEPKYTTERIQNKLVVKVGAKVKPVQVVEVGGAPAEKGIAGAVEEVPAEEEVTGAVEEEVAVEKEVEGKAPALEEKEEVGGPAEQGAPAPGPAEVKEPEVQPPTPPAPVKAPSVPVYAPGEVRTTLQKKKTTIETSKQPYFVFKPEEVGMKKKYTGRKISLVFKDADIRDVLRVIAQVSNLNIIAGDDVKGKITIRLINVPWDQALDIILQSQGLGMVKIGNVVRIAPLEKLQKERERIAQAKRSYEKVQELVTKLIPVNYGSADEFADKIKKLLTDRGSVEVDKRTNTIIVKDVPSVIEQAEKLVELLDLQTPQVLISSRIVEVQDRFTRELGIQWGGSFEASPRYGNATGLFFPSAVNVFGNIPVAGAGGGGGGAATGIGQLSMGEPQQLFAVNLPAAVGVGSGGSFGLILGTINNSGVLDLRLSAMETTGKGKVISSPKVLTLDNREAVIKQGVSIPYETVSQSGTQTQFVDATLSLKVTPHITADRSVIMKLKIEKNAPNPALRSAGGVPSIDKKEAQTEILVHDGETAVIGGIYTISKSESVSGVPLLSRIPILGWLFRKKARTHEKTELLVFITPRVIVRR